MGIKETNTSNTEARYFARITCISVKGLVNNKSRVPAFLSSANMRMVIAGTRKRNTQGAMKKRGSSVAYPPSMIFISPGNTHRNRLVMARNSTITIYPVSELKNPRISFFSRLSIVSISAHKINGFLKRSKRLIFRTSSPLRL